MKKLLLGCLGVSVVLVIAGGVLGYFYVYKPARSFVAGVSQFGEVAELNAQISNKASFMPPEGGLLTQAMVDRYMSAQQSLRARMGPRLAELEAKYKKFETDTGEEASIRDALGAVRDLGTLVLEAKRAQVAALNEQGFSLAEYEWVQKTMYHSVGVPFGSTFQDVLRQAGAEPGAATPPSMDFATTDAPEANRLLVEPHAQALKDHVALAFFGL